MNGRKGKHEDVLDPFTIQEGWFELHFPSLQVHPNENLDEDAKSQIWATIHRLDLNGATCVSGRRSWIQPYLNGVYPLSFVREKAPFMAHELTRQNLQDINMSIWDAFKQQDDTISYRW
ncbi:hypothetical protein [Dictyobacter vulcani]|nr:hypothetical protein [Dictyobacter vulcani]